MDKEIYLAIQINDNDSLVGDFAGIYDNYSAAQFAAENGDYQGLVWTLDLNQIKSVYTPYDDDDED